jgi:hypothetical protein
MALKIKNELLKLRKFHSTIIKFNNDYKETIKADLSIIKNLLINFDSKIIKNDKTKIKSDLIIIKNKLNDLNIKFDSAELTKKNILFKKSKNDNKDTLKDNILELYIIIAVVIFFCYNIIMVIEHDKFFDKGEEKHIKNYLYKSIPSSIFFPFYIIEWIFKNW